ncbi:LysM domain-containing protein [Colletotrichum siamense]|uniref:LysM domain-containing protein n=1 Tax=Colletotrichum siamense TaxID=690259 RepID=UPI001872A544|nr:LysM domain-containing protein [Colletotrichum siamense]KAF5482996.1 LysM domain-containing protein [Colletotrichum siamense]
MLSYVLPSLLLAGSFVDVAQAGVAHVRRDGSSPSLTYDPNTTSYCTWWVDLTTAKTCSVLLSENAIDLVSFRRWNPSITETCVLQTGHSYCVEAFFEPPVSTAGPSTTSTIKTTSTTTTPPTTTSTGNGISTPQPTQAQIVSNCNKFYFVKSGESCSTVASSNGITLAQFLEWNPSAGSTCAGLWANAYACVGIIGGATITSSPPTTTTSTGNGIATPTPTQPNMVGNCDSFYFVKSGDTCAAIASKSGISVSQFVDWNPSVGSSCGGLWLDAYVCISIIGHTPTTPTPTSPGNGVATPTPIQDGMTKSCKKFHYVVSGNTCTTIASQYGITVAQFTSWNPAVGSSCTGLWLNTYACVAVL